MKTYQDILKNKSTTADEKADAIIATMVTGAVALAIIPAHVNWALFASLLGFGVIAIGQAYGDHLTEKEAWKLIRMFVNAAGWTFFALTVGSKLLAAILTSTGLGHIAAVAMDSTISGAIAYAIGMAGKAYFKGEHDRAEVGRVLRNAFNQKRKDQV